MATVEYCPDCGQRMYNDVYQEEEKGFWVTCVCKNNDCPTYKNSGNRCMKKVFDDK